MKAAKGKVKLVKMNIDEHPAIPGQMGIQSIPAVIAFVNGQPVDGFMGALPESQVVAFLERLTKDKIGGEDAGPAEGGRRGARRRRCRRRGRACMRSCCRRTPATCRRSPASRAAMSRPARSSRPSRRSRWCRKQSATTRRSPPRAPRSRSPSRPKSVGPLDELEKKVAANPLDHQARFDLAIALNANGKREEAADHLLEIVKRDRKWNDDGARKQLVQFFEAWGSADPATVEGRKRLSSILFS